MHGITAVFVGVIVGLILEPMPGAVIGLTGVVAIALTSQWVLFSRQTWRHLNLNWPQNHSNGRLAGLVTPLSG